MKCLVTGSAGFIGSHLSRRLLAEGYEIIGLDCFSDFYPRWIKERNLAPLQGKKGFRLVEADILALDLAKILSGVEAVFHLAAQAGVRTSWGENFFLYVKNNIQATQSLLEAAKALALQKFIYASSSSVYGLTPILPMSETNPLIPLSPYGVTKLAAEHLALLYWKNFAVPTVSLRFFTVYGPGQRPDMAFHKFFRSIAEGKPATIFGDGKQTRDFTYIDDIIEACLAALERGRPGETYNVGGGHQEMLVETFPLLEEICSKKINILWAEKQKGDVSETLADITKARRELDYSPRTALREGLREEWDWIQKLYSS